MVFYCKSSGRGGPLLPEDERKYYKNLEGRFAGKWLLPEDDICYNSSEVKMIKRTRIKSNTPVLYMKEGDIFVCYSPAFDLAAHGDSFEDAEKSFAVTLKLFIEEVTKKGTWDEVLQEYGWKKINKEWSPSTIIGQQSKPIEIPA